MKACPRFLTVQFPHASPDEITGAIDDAIDDAVDDAIDDDRLRTWELTLASLTTIDAGAKGVSA